MTGETCGVECAQAVPSCPASPGSPLTWGWSVLSIEEILADSEDEDSEQEERSRGKEQRRLTRQRSRAWLKEGGGDEPLNFLDPKVAQRVLGEQQAAGSENRPALLTSLWARGRPSPAHMRLAVLQTPVQGTEPGWSVMMRV